MKLENLIKLVPQVREIYTLVSTLFVAIMAFTSDLFLQKLMDKLTFLTESDTRTPLLGTTGSAPYTYAEPYHLGSGSHGKLFRPYYN